MNLGVVLLLQGALSHADEGVLYEVRLVGVGFGVHQLSHFVLGVCELGALRFTALLDFLLLCQFAHDWDVVYSWNVETVC